MNAHSFTQRTSTYLRDTPTDDLVSRYGVLRVLCRRMEREGKDIGAQVADEGAQAISAELRARLEQWLGNVPLADFIEAL